MTRLGPLCLLIMLALTALPPHSAAAAVPANGRAWELVTPEEPVGATVHRGSTVTADGKRILYLTFNALPGAPAGDILASNLATRSESGWETEPLGFPYETAIDDFPPSMAAFSADLSKTVWRSEVSITPAGHVLGGQGLYVREPDGHPEFIADLGDDRESLLAVSADAGTVVFSTRAHLLDSDAGRTVGESIYEYTGSSLRQVDVDAAGDLFSTCGSAFLPSDGLSISGERIFFTSPAPSCSELSSVYLREGGDSITEVSASRCSRVDCGAEQPATFAGATPDGMHAYLTTSQQLTDDDVDEVSDLYRFDVGSGKLTRISTRAPGASGAVTPKRVLASDDGLRVYFYVSGRLHPDEGTEGGSNLYVADAAGLRFVAPVNPSDPLQISTDGRIALLETAVSLEADDTDGLSDVYRYDAESGGLARLSRGIDDNDPFEASILPQVGPLLEEPEASRALDDAGRHLFFATEEPLVPEDSNEELDVYEWNGGKLGLISGGVPGEESEFVTVSADGSTVVFKTAATLLANDRDGGDRDLYVARVGGGFPQATVPGECGAGCDSALPGRLLRPVPPTALGAKSRPARIRLHGLERRFGRRLVASGRAVLKVWASDPGLMTARGVATIGGRERTVARGSAGIVRAGAVDLSLVATEAARRSLASGAALRVRLVLRQGDVRLVRQMRWKAEPR